MTSWRSSGSLFPVRAEHRAEASPRHESESATTAEVIAMPGRATSAAVRGSLALRAETSRQQPAPAAAKADETPLSEEVRHRVHSALDRLDRLERAKQALGGEEALRQLVSDLLEPMLRQWLDKNLADIVERRVREEIERLFRRS